MAAWGVEKEKRLNDYVASALKVRAKAQVKSDELRAQLLAIKAAEARAVRDAERRNQEEIKSARESTLAEKRAACGAVRSGKMRELSEGDPLRGPLQSARDAPGSAREPMVLADTHLAAAWLRWRRGSFTALAREVEA